MLITDKLKEKKDFSKGEELIAEFILEQGENIKDYSARTIAKETYTSPATVLNLCKKVGIDGFNHFKEAYLKEIEYLNQNFGEIDANTPFLEQDSIGAIAHKLGNLYEETIKDTLQLLQNNALQEAVQVISKGNNFHIYSVGTALNIAESFKEKMMKIGKNVYITNNLNYQRYEVNCLSSQDAVLFISYSGETKSILEMARICKRRNIPFITMTSFGENTLSKLSDIHLYISTREKLVYNIGNFTSNLSINFLLDLLYSVYFSSNYKNNYEYKIAVTKKAEMQRHSSNPILVDEDKDF